MVRKGQTSIDTCLIFNVDKPDPFDAWMLYDNLSFFTGYNAASSTLVETATGSFIYTGDYSGRVWKLETEALNDNSHPIEMKMVFPRQDFLVSNRKKNIPQLFIDNIDSNKNSLVVDINIDNNNLASQTITFSGSFKDGELWNVPIWNQFFWGKPTDDGLLNLVIRRSCRYIQLTLSNDVLNEDMLINSVIYNYKVLK